MGEREFSEEESDQTSDQTSDQIVRKICDILVDGHQNYSSFPVYPAGDSSGLTQKLAELEEQHPREYAKARVLFRNFTPSFQ